MGRSTCLENVASVGTPRRRVHGSLQEGRYIWSIICRYFWKYSGQIHYQSDLIDMTKSDSATRRSIEWYGLALYTILLIVLFVVELWRFVNEHHGIAFYRRRPLLWLLCLAVGVVVAFAAHFVIRYREKSGTGKGDRHEKGDKSN